MIELDQRIAEQLTEITLNSSLQVRCGSSNSFLVTASLIEPLINEFQMGGVYISASRPAPELISTKIFLCILCILAIVSLIPFSKPFNSKKENHRPAGEFKKRE